jgi:lipopolysaccharide export system permease protein
LFLALARSSELVVVRAAGRSGLSFLLAPVAMAALLGAFAVTVLDPLVAATSKMYDRMQTQGSDAVMSISSNGLWMRQGTTDAQTVIRATRGNPDGSEINDVTFQTFSTDGTPTERIEAETARLEPGIWVLSGAKRWDLTADNPEQLAETPVGDIRVATDLNQDRIRNSFGEPSSIAFWNLRRQINDLEKAGFSARSYRVWMQMELAMPLLLVAMVLIAAGFTMRHARSGKTGQMVLLALLGGFAIFFLRNFAQVLGVNAQIPIALAAWGPPVAGALMALGLLLHLEDG